MKYANYDYVGNIIGFYDDTIHDAIPEPSVKLTDAQWLDCIDNNGRRRIDVNTGTVVEYTPPPPRLSDIQTVVKASIDAAAGMARMRFVSGGEMIDQEYKRTEQVARDYVTAGYPVTVPLAIQAEVDRTGSTAQQAADNIIATANALNHALDQIRAARLAGKAAIAACVAINPDVPTQAELDTLTSAEAAAIAMLDAITPSVTGS